MEKKITELTEIEIKALLYDQIVVLENAKSNIGVLQNELKRRLENNQSKEPKDDGFSGS